MKHLRETFQECLNCNNGHLKNIFFKSPYIEFKTEFTKNL